MKQERAESILKRLESFASIQRKATDEVGWIQLAYGVSRSKAARLIEQAREWKETQTDALRMGVSDDYAR